MVIPNLDGAHWLERCLPSLSAGRLRPAAIIVADDGSTDASERVADENGATFLASPRSPRSGFAATANRGLAAVPEDARWVLLLNNDTEVDAELVAELLGAGNRHPEAMILAPLVLSLRDRERVDSAGLLLYADGVARPRWHGERVGDLVLTEELVLLASGAALAVRREALALIGHFDEGLGSYLEDVDWGLRAARRGALAMFVPSAVVYHHFSGTSGARSAAKARLIERNRVIVAGRHLPLERLLGSAISTPRRWAVLAAGQREAGERGAGLAAILGLLAGHLRLPGALVERRRLARSGLSWGRHWRRRLARHSCDLDAFRTFGASEPPDEER